MNLVAVEKENKICLLTFSSSSSALSCRQWGQVPCFVRWLWKLPCFWFGSFSTFFAFFCFRRGGGQFSLLTWAHPRRWTCSKMPRFSGAIPICNHIQVLQDKFHMRVILLPLFFNISPSPFSDTQYTVSWMTPSQDMSLPHSFVHYWLHANSTSSEVLWNGLIYH